MSFGDDSAGSAEFSVKFKQLFLSAIHLYLSVSPMQPTDASLNILINLGWDYGVWYSYHLGVNSILKQSKRKSN